jgi:GLPGLI family protein
MNPKTNNSFQPIGKISLVFLGWMLFAALGFSQQVQGVVHYVETMVFKVDSSRLSDPRYQQMMTMFQNPPSFKKHLRVCDTASLYVQDPQDLEVTSPDDPSARWKMMMRQENEVYRNFNSGELVEYADFMGKKFLIAGEEARTWKISMEQKEIAGYPCMKATAVDSNGTHEVWFTMSIPVSSGPRSIGGLPGLVLEANMANARFNIKAEKVDLRPLSSDEPLMKPDKGKSVTREEYRSIVREKMKEMQQNGGGGPWMRGGGH